LGDKLAKTGDGKDVTITFSVPTEYVAPATGDSLATIIGKITKRLNDLGDLAFKDTIEEADLPSGTVIDANYVHTDNNFTNSLKTSYDDAVTKAHTHTNKSVLDGIAGVLTEIPATPGSNEGHLATVGAIRALYNNPDLDWDGDAETVDGFDASVENVASTIPVRDADAIINVSGVDIAGHPITWNNSDGTLDVELSNNVVLQVGQETLYQVRNESGSTILNGTAVYCTGVTAGSGRMEISPAIGTLDPVTFLGLATQDISNGVNGFVTHFGYTRGLDTRGTEPSSIAVGDENWAVGDKLYVHPTVAGKLTNVEPQAPYVKICVASVITRHQSTGVLFVRPTTNLDIKKLSDVQIGTLANNDLISYNNTNNRWENKTLANLDLLTATTAASTYQPIGNYATLTDGKLSDDVIPSLAISNTSVVADETAMLALTAQVGDVAIRTDVSKTFILSASPATTLENWKEILTPAGGVASVSATAPIVSSGGTNPTISISDATTSAAGSMSSTDKTKLDGIEANANNYAHPTGFSNQPTSALTGASVISQITVNTNGHTTGVSTRNLTAANIGAATTTTYTSTLVNTTWVGSSAPFTRAITISGILSTDEPIIDIDFTSVAYADVAGVQTAWGKVYRAVTSANTITFYASEIPAVNVPFIAKVVR
jgi:hypothetical protein